MTLDSTKWQRVSHQVLKCGFCPCPRDAAQCKTKWNQIIPDYKCITDFFARTGTNGAHYWDLTFDERRSEGLSRAFAQDLFYSIHEWFGSRPSMQPPHTRDLLSHEDGNYDIQTQHHAEEQEVLEDSEPPSEDPMDIAAEAEGTADTNSHTPSGQHDHSSDGTSGGPKTAQNAAPTPRQRPPLRAGVTPVLISSSKCSASRRLGNTAVRRKSLSSHNLIAQATRASGDVMASQMQEMAEASRDLERSNRGPVEVICRTNGLSMSKRPLHS